MKSSEKLRSEYEEALFAVLMDKVIQAEGEALLAENERLKNDPDFVLPEGLDDRCLETIDNVFKARKGKRIGKTFFRTLLAAALVSAMLFTTAYATNPEVKAVVRNFVYEVTDMVVNLEFETDTSDSGDTTPKTLAGYTLPSVPEEYDLAEEFSDRFSACVQYVNGDERIIIEVVYDDEYSNSCVDAENASITEMTINAFSAILIEKDDHVQVVLTDEENGNYIELTCSDVSVNEVVSMACEIRFIR